MIGPINNISEDSPEIKKLRISANMTQAEFSRYFNIPMRTLGNWENELNKCQDYIVELIRYKLVKEGILLEENTP